MIKIIIGFIIGFFISFFITLYICTTHFLIGIDVILENLNNWAVPSYTLLTIIIVFSALISIKTQTTLHREIHRPVIIGDFLRRDGSLYFRLKNFGNFVAHDIRLEIEIINKIKEKGEKNIINLLKKLNPFENGINILPPNGELMYFLRGPGESLKDTLFVLTIKYTDSSKRKFKEFFSYKVADFSNIVG